MSDDTKMIPGGIAFGLPVMVSPIVPRDEVWLRTKDDLVRVCNLANGESEVTTLRARLAAVERLADDWEALSRRLIDVNVNAELMRCARALRAALRGRTEQQQTDGNR